MRPLALLLLAALAGPAMAATVQPPAPQLGERATLSLGAAPADSTRFPLGLGVALERSGPATWSLLVVAVGEVGVVLPGPAGADTLSWEVAGQVEQADPSLARPLHPGPRLRANWWPHLLLLALLLALLGLWAWRRLMAGRGEAALNPVPDEPPHVVALRRLAELERSGWLAAGDAPRFYVEASDALRAFVGGRFGVPALDWTSRETAERLAGSGHPPATSRELLPLLREADAVKFAGEQPAEPDGRAWIQAARGYIGRHAVEPVFQGEAARAAARRLGGGR